MFFCFCFLSGKKTNCQQVCDLLSLDYFSKKKWKIGLAKKNATENTFQLGIGLKFLYSEKATNFFEIFTLPFSVCTADKSKVKISQNFVSFSK